MTNPERWNRHHGLAITIPKRWNRHHGLAITIPKRWNQHHGLLGEAHVCGPGMVEVVAGGGVVVRHWDSLHD